MLMNEAPEPGEKAISTLDTLIAPFEVLFRRRSKKREQTRRIRAIEVNQIFGVDNVFFRFRHFFDPSPFYGSAALRAFPAFFFRTHQLSGKQPVMLGTAIGLF